MSNPGFGFFLDDGEIGPRDEDYWEHETAEDPPKEDKVSGRVEVDLPWSLETIEFTDEEVVPPEPVERQIRWLEDSHVGGVMDEEFYRVFLAAALLYQKYPDRGMPACLEQAVIWERG